MSNWQAGLTAAKILCTSAWILFPTFVMGLSFPAMTHFLKNRYGDTPRCQAEINTFYGFNLLGGALAAFAAPYLIFPYAGLDRALIGCFALECCVLFAALRVSANVEIIAPRREPVRGPAARLPRDAAALIAFAFLSGFLFFGLEVLWVHLSASVIGTSVYAFANTLLAVLVGLNLGNRLVLRLSWPDRYAWCHSWRPRTSYSNSVSNKPISRKYLPAWPPRPENILDTSTIPCCNARRSSCMSTMAAIFCCRPMRATT
jgi:hypothetical protein